MFGIGPTEMIFFLVILLLAVGPDRLPTFMRTVGKGLRQVRSASREFKDAIGLDELMREGDPFRAPPVRPPRARPVPVQSKTPPPPPKPSATEAAQTESAEIESEPAPESTDESDVTGDADVSAEAKHP